MKRLLLSLALVLAASLGALAQDIIILRNSEKIEAKIVEISSTEIAYKKADYTDGPTFRLDISEVSSIIYANGDVQAFNEEPRKEQGNVSSDSGSRNGKLKFNPTPQGRKRPFGISIGYTSKQMALGPLKVSMLSEEIGKTSPALMVGFYWAPEFKYGIGIQTGLYYELAAYNGTYTDYEDYYNEVEKSYSNTEHTLSIPLRVQYRYEIIRDLSVFLYTGPSFDIHLAYLASYGGEKDDYYKGDSSLNRFQMLWGVGAGVRWKGLQLMMGGDWGLTNYYKGDAVKVNKPFFISLSYLF